MKRILLSLFIISFLASCSLNLYRFNDPTKIDLDEEKSKFLESHSEVDTLLICKESNCQLYSEKEMLIIYKSEGITKSRLYSNVGNYPNEIIINLFNWDSVSFMLNREFLLEKLPPRYYALVEDGDTTWYDANNSYMSGETIWVFDFFSSKDSVSWEYYFDVLIFPKVKRTQVSDYILDEKDHHINEFGKQKLKKMPIISTKRAYN